MKKNVGLTTLLNKNFKTYELNEEWLNTIGPVEQNFRMLIWGPSGGGKTTFALRLIKHLSTFRKVYYNSIEQGLSKSLQDGVKRCGLDECTPGSIVFGDRDSYDDMFQKLRTNRAGFVVIDSLQYLNLTTAQYKQLISKFPRKAFIIISWEGSAEQPKGEYAKSIRYMADVKCYVKNGKAKADSRFGNTEPYTIFEKKNAQPTLF